MIKDKRLILCTLGGAAIMAGAYIYFKKKKLTIEQQYQQLFQQFSHEILNLKISNQGNHQLKYDKLLYLSIYDENDKQSTLSDKIAFLDIDQLKNQGSCTNKINVGAIFYECYDCCPSKKENAQITNDFNENATFQTICEDCFKDSGHQNHKFVRQEQDGIIGSMCQCGVSNLVDKKGFCKNHQGYDKIKQLHYDQIQKKPLTWKGIERFLIDSFYYYFESVSILLSQKIHNTINQEIFLQKHNRVNYFLQSIINKINEIIELNPPSIFLMADIFSKTFHKPISLLVKKNANEKCPNKYTRLIQKEKQVNNDLTILDCLLLTYEVVNQETDQLICKLFNYMAAASDTFPKFLCEKFYKMIGFVARVQTSKDQWSCSSLFPTFIEIVMFSIFLQSVFDHLVNTLGEDIFNVLEYLTYYIKNIQKFEENIDENFILLPCVLFDMFRMINQLKILIQKYPKQLVGSIFDLNQELFFCDSFKFYQAMGQQSQISTLAFFPQYFNVQKEMINSQIYIFQVLKLINDEELTQKVVSIICETFAEHILKLSSDLVERENKFGNYLSFSISSFVCLPYLIATTESKMFTKHSIENFFDSHFTFKNKDAKINFFKSIRKIFYSFVLSKADELNILIENLCRSDMCHEEYIEETFESLYSPSYKFDEFYVFLSSVMILTNHIDDSFRLESPPQQLLISLKQFMRDSNQISFYKSIYYSRQITYLFLDSRPLFNLFAQKLKLFFPEVSSNEENSIKKVIKKNVEEIIVSCVQVTQHSKMNLNDVLQICKPYINDEGLLRENYLSVFDQQESEDFISLKKQYRQKLYQRHILRNQNHQLTDITQKIGINLNESTQDFSLAGSDFSIENLLPYQLDLFKQLFLDEQFVKEMVNIYFEKNFSYYAEDSIKPVLLMFLKFITQREQDNILNEQEKVQAQKILEIIPLERLKEKYKTNISNLKQQEYIVSYKTCQNIISMLDQLLQVQK